jgi:Na+-driven multidrug efflux pump
MIMMATGIFIITYFASSYGQEVIAAYGIGMRIEQIVLMPTIGLSVAVLAIVSQNNGAKQFDRIEETLNISLYYGAIISLVGMFLLLVGAEQFIHFFSEDRIVIEEGALYLRVEAFILFSFVVIFVHLSLLQAIERPGFIFYISIFRQVIAPIVLLGVLSSLGLEVVWIWIGIASIVTFSAFVTWRYSRTKLNEVLKREA